MKAFAEKSPLLFSLAIFLLESGVALPFVASSKLLGLDLKPLMLIIPVAQSVFVLWVLYVLGWLRATGFNGSIRDMHVLWFPLLLAFVPVLVAGTIEVAPGGILFFGLAVLFTGLSEEGLARGILLKALLPKGAWFALLFMSTLFSISHFSNLVFADFSVLQMTEKLLISFSTGLLYGAVFLRTRNIWPLIFLHTFLDYSYLISGTAGPYLTEPFPPELHLMISALNILYALYIMRRYDLASASN